MALRGGRLRGDVAQPFSVPVVRAGIERVALVLLACIPVTLHVWAVDALAAGCPRVVGPARALEQGRGARGFHPAGDALLQYNCREDRTSRAGLRAAARRAVRGHEKHLRRLQPNSDCLLRPSLRTNSRGDVCVHFLLNPLV
eukprot:scaffold5925_cov60-Phaeocystis_antarctica.AAC.3